MKIGKIVMMAYSISAVINLNAGWAFNFFGPNKKTTNVNENNNVKDIAPAPVVEKYFGSNKKAINVNEKNNNVKGMALAPVVEKYVVISETFDVKNIQDKKFIRIFGDEFVSQNKSLKMIINEGKKQDIGPWIETHSILKSDKSHPTKRNLIPNNNQDKGKLIRIVFVSQEFNINYQCECYQNQYFGEVTNMLLEKYPIYNNKHFLYLCNGIMIDQNKTLKQNGIGDMAYVLLIDENNGNKNKDNSEVKINIVICVSNEKSIVSLKGMFANCDYVKKIEISNNIISDNIIDVSNMFLKCSSLETINDISTWNTRNIKHFDHMFDNCTKLDKVSQERANNLLRKFNKGNKVYSFEIAEIFDKDKVKNLSQIKIFGNEFIKNNKDRIKISINNGSEQELCSHIDKKHLIDSRVRIRLFVDKPVKSLKGMFIECRHIVHISGLKYIVTDKVNDMSYMFQGCESLRYISDTCMWNTKNVENMRAMFHRCKSLKSILNVYTWDTRKVADMERMFYMCSSLDKVDAEKLGNENTIKKDIFTK